MYGGITCFKEGCYDNPYYKAALEKPSPVTDGFDKAYFSSLLENDGDKKLSAKAFLATNQRIPGIGNGVLQDILWRAHINPRRKLGTLSEDELSNLFSTLKSVLNQMIEGGGRDTEKDLFGAAGGYITVMSKNNDGMPCPSCGGFIKKEAYMGGSVYYCETCQPLNMYAENSTK